MLRSHFSNPSMTVKTHAVYLEAYEKAALLPMACTDLVANCPFLIGERRCNINIIEVLGALQGALSSSSSTKSMGRLGRGPKAHYVHVAIFALDSSAL